MFFLVVFERNFDDNAEPPMFVRSRGKAMRRAIGLRQTVLDVRQADSGALGIDRVTPRPRPAVGHLYPYRPAFAARGDPDIGAMFGPSDGIFDRVFDQRLEQQ